MLEECKIYGAIVQTARDFSNWLKKISACLKVPSLPKSCFGFTKAEIYSTTLSKVNDILDLVFQINQFVFEINLFY